MTAKESEQNNKGKFPLVTFVKLQATPQSIESFFFFILWFSDCFVDNVIKLLIKVMKNKFPG